MVVEFFVPGLPIPGGSKKAFVNRHTGRANIVDDTGQRGKHWRSDVKKFASEAYQGPLLDVPLAVVMEFVMPRPKGHFGSGRNAQQIKPAAPRWPTSPPDVLKLARAAEDAITGVVWSDDSRTVSLRLIKRYVGPDDRGPGLRVKIEEMQPCSSVT